MTDQYDRIKQLTQAKEVLADLEDELVLKCMKLDPNSVTQANT
jgi:hypothetical protein